MGQFVWWIGVAEDRMDPKKLGRIRVRMFGYHTDDKALIPTEQLFWAYPMQPIVSGAMNGIGVSPTGIVEGTHVIGFFRDGHNAQDPVILGTIGGIPGDKRPSKGFFDPNGQYPRDDFMDEPDTNRLARAEKIEETVVQTKKDNLDEDVKMSLDDGEWTEPETPYNARYPFNHVRETESGHIEEWDDTEGSERFHRYHPSGTFIEDHPDGVQVRKIQNDKYEIVLGDEYIHIKGGTDGKSGNLTVTIEGDANMLVKGNTRLETEGDRDEYVHGDYQLLVGGTMKVKCNNRIYVDGGPRIDLNLPGPSINF
jgi:hypothetical protein